MRKGWYIDKPDCLEAENAPTNGEREATESVILKDR